MDESHGGTVPGLPQSPVPGSGPPPPGESAAPPAGAADPAPGGEPAPAGTVPLADAPDVPPARSPRGGRWGGPIPWVVLGATALLVASLAVALVVVPPEIDAGPGSPAGAVRAYAAAIAAGRYAEAFDLLDTNARMGQTVDDFSSMGAPFGDQEQRLDVIGVSQDGTRATVRARLTMTYAGQSQGQDVEIVLVRAEGRWLIDTPMYGLMPEPEF